MLKMFADITQALTDEEKSELVPMLIDRLKNSNTDNRMLGKALTAWFRASGRNMNEGRLRKMINYVRVTNAFGDKILIGAGNGYFLTEDIHEANDQVESIEGRIDSMQAVVEAIKAQIANLKWKAKKRTA